MVEGEGDRSVGTDPEQGLAPLSAIHLMFYSLTGLVAKGHPGA